jgi:hypothetical protein
MVSCSFEINQAGAKKHSEFSCSSFLPDAARSEYFLVDALPLVDAASATAATAISSPAGKATTTTTTAAGVGRVVVSRVWKTALLL